MSKTTIPKKLYVTMQYRGDTGNQDGILGFASPYTQDDAFSKRKITQDHWAYGSGLNIDIRPDDAVTVAGTGASNGRQCDAGVLFATNCFPRIVRNEPLEGFQLAHSVRRHGWSGKGNVLWRITDPRGFDLEITSENFASLLDCVTLARGVIQGPCIWGRMGPRNILLPENSEPYQQAVKLTQKVSRQVSLRDVQRGDLVEIISNRVPQEHQKCYFLGKVILVKAERNHAPAGNFTGVFELAGRQEERYVIESVLDGSYHALNSVKISEILERRTEPLTPDEAAARCNSRLQADENEFEEANVILARKTPPREIQYLLAEHNPVSVDNWPSYGKYYRETFVVRRNQQLYVTSGKNYHRQHEMLLTPVTWDSDRGELALDMMPQTSNYWWSGRTAPDMPKSEVCTDFTGFDFFRISVVTPQQEIQPVRFLGYF